MLPVVKNQETYYHLNLISNAPGDNKPVDCAFAAGADYIVSDDRDFKPLLALDFPNST